MPDIGVGSSSPGTLNSVAEQILADIAAGAADAALDARLADLGATNAESPEPFLRVAAALVACKRLGQAEQVLGLARDTFPNDERTAQDHAALAFHRREWPEACRRWQRACETFPHVPRFVAQHSIALNLAGRVDEADALLHAAMARFPRDAGIAIEFARLPIRHGRSLEALPRCADLRRSFPGRVEGYSIGAQALCELGRFDEAEDFLEEVRDRFPKNFHYLFQSAWTATRQNRWQEAFRRWGVVKAAFPNLTGVDRAIGEAIILWQHAEAEGDVRACGISLPEFIMVRAGQQSSNAASPSSDGSVRISDRDLLLAFEGLGDRCEFGLVQRHFGAEPIGLLRWSEISPQNLVALLRSRFAGVGEMANTFVRINPDGREYFSGDRRYFLMHTFVKEHEITQDAFLKKMTARMAYLREKLIADLDEGDKIFVYKRTGADVSDDEADEIVAAMYECYPRSTLLLVRQANEPHPAGSVVRTAKRAMSGYLSSFLTKLDNRFILYDEWRSICVAALAMKQEIVRPSG